MVAGLFQSFAVRASGFPIVSIAALAPSFQSVFFALPLSTEDTDPFLTFNSQIPLYCHDVHRGLPGMSVPHNNDRDLY